MTNDLTGNQIRYVDVAGRPILSPLTITPFSVLSAPAYWRAVNFIAENLASFPRRIRPPKQSTAQDADHPLDLLLGRRPNHYQNPFIFWRTLFFHAIGGNGYALIERNGTTPRALHNWLPEDVRPVRVTFEDGTVDQFYHHKPTKRTAHGSDVIHLQTISHDGQAGIDLVGLHDGTIQRATLFDRYVTKYLESGTVIRGTVEIPHHVEDDQLEQIRGEINRHYVGSSADRDLLILTDGAKLNNSTISPQESQLGQQTALSTKQICQILGVPPAFVYELSEEKYRSSVEQDGQNVVRYTFRPWIEQIEDELSIKLLGESDLVAGYTVRINPDALLRGDSKTQSDTLTAQVGAGIRTPNESREALDLPRSTDAEADRLKRQGDTAPQQPTPAP